MEFEVLKKRSCAGIVTYNPDLETLEKNISSLYDQVDTLVIVDNNSNNQAEIEDMFVEKNKISILKNPENYGIAKALNQIFQYAKENRYQWFLTMDQDSLCSKDLMKEYAEAYKEEDNIAIYSPFILNNQKITLEQYSKLDLKPIEVVQEPLGCITSGCLTNVQATEDVAGFDEELFIDCVDADFNLKLSLLNYKIVRVNSTYMLQAMGEAKKVKLLDWLYHITNNKKLQRLRFTPVYNKTRLYYISRNSRYIRYKYGKLSGKRLSSSWMRGQYLYYFLTYPSSYSRSDLLDAIKRGKEDFKKMIENY